MGGREGVLLQLGALLQSRALVRLPSLGFTATLSTHFRFAVGVPHLRSATARLSVKAELQTAILRPTPEVSCGLTGSGTLPITFNSITKTDLTDRGPLGLLPKRQHLKLVDFVGSALAQGRPYL